jgi:hypothetical protein
LFQKWILEIQKPERQLQAEALDFWREKHPYVLEKFSEGELEVLSLLSHPSVAFRVGNNNQAFYFAYDQLRCQVEGFFHGPIIYSMGTKKTHG